MTHRITNLDHEKTDCPACTQRLEIIQGWIDRLGTVIETGFRTCRSCRKLYKIYQPESDIPINRPVAVHGSPACMKVETLIDYAEKTGRVGMEWKRDDPFPDWPNYAFNQWQAHVTICVKDAWPSLSLLDRAITYMQAHSCTLWPNPKMSKEEVITQREMESGLIAAAEAITTAWMEDNPFDANDVLHPYEWTDWRSHMAAYVYGIWDRLSLYVKAIAFLQAYSVTGSEDPRLDEVTTQKEPEPAVFKLSNCEKCIHWTDRTPNMDKTKTYELSGGLSYNAIGYCRQIELLTGNTFGCPEFWDRESAQCPDCGYTEKDRRIHLDHHLCKAYPFFPDERVKIEGEQRQAFKREEQRLARKQEEHRKHIDAMNLRREIRQKQIAAKQAKKEREIAEDRKEVEQTRKDGKQAHKLGDGKETGADDVLPQGNVEPK